MGVCLRTEQPSEIVALPTADAAADWLRDGRCATDCISEHVLVWCEPGALRIARRARGSPPADLAAALRAAGYQRPRGGTSASTADRWPRPSIYNQPLPTGGPPMNPAETRRRQDQAIADAADRELTPHPDGLAGRARDARKVADTSLDPADHRFAHAIQGALDAEQAASGTRRSAVPAPRRRTGQPGGHNRHPNAHALVDIEGSRLV